MKVLWFTNTPSLYDEGKHVYHGGGWIESLERLIQRRNDIELAVAFFHHQDQDKLVKNGVTYYPIKFKRGRANPIKALIDNWSSKLTNEGYEKNFSDIVIDFEPDLIHVFGTEGPYASIQEYTDVPVVLHIQGLINPCVDAYFPPSVSDLDFLFSPIYFFQNLLGSSPYWSYKLFEKQADREKKFLKQAKYVLGRTSWDKKLTQSYNPSITYFHVNEVLREAFYEDSRNLFPPSRSGEELEVVSTLSPTIYKGIDGVYKVASRVKSLNPEFQFKWKVIGVNRSDKIVAFMEAKLGLSHQDLNIDFLGRLDAKSLKNELVTASLYVHPSFIDNSPNSVCEAQMLGIPVLACDVGGVSTLVEHGHTGFLVPANGVHEIAAFLIGYPGKLEMIQSVVEKARQVSTERHSTENIEGDLLRTYMQVLGKNFKLTI